MNLGKTKVSVSPVFIRGLKIIKMAGRLRTVSTPK
jgi:hypothetical protein